MKKYVLTCEEVCPECGGKGILSDPIYREYYEAEREYLKQNRIPLGDEAAYHDHRVAMEQWTDAWFAHRGYPGGVKHWPAEEYECDTCTGTGVHIYDIELMDALRELGIIARLESASNVASCLANGILPD